MRSRFTIFVFLGLLGFFPIKANAALPSLTYRYKHFLITVSSRSMTDWQTEQEVWTYNGEPITPPARFRVDGDDVPDIPDGLNHSMRLVWNREAIKDAIEELVGPTINRSAGTVTISRSSSGSILFDGVGFPGQAIDLNAAVELTIHALETHVTNIDLPVIITNPAVNVNDSELRSLGIKELVTIGESDFHGSTANRIHNVTTGLNRFNGHLIQQGETFSFDKTLGPVNASTGYRKELTIIGDKTLPDYGGGLCQVSSTAYRGVWEYGFPILQRKNHSFAVHYYAPQGTDATVYPPNVDIKFLNDSPGALLMQTAIDVPHTKAYFLYYGTKDDRKTKVIGPFTWGYKPAPPPRTELTTEIPPDTKRKVGEAVPGMQAAWFRIVEKDGKKDIEKVFSSYEARPLYYQIGVAELPAGSGSLTTAPQGETVISD